ncbi:MAG: hypothetical protein HOP18_23395 [Deltaproteobacteria bacterium]|nr:hypothetical protein [Deltaproteobacteria bacterium]
MKIVGIRELRAKSAHLLGGAEPVLVTRHGKVSGVYVPLADPTRLPDDLRRELATTLGKRLEKHWRDRAWRSSSSPRISLPLASVVADANVLLSAVAGKAAVRVFTEFGLTVHVAEFTADEVVESRPVTAWKYAMASELIEMPWRFLAVHRHPAFVYRRALPRAIADLAQRDPEDAHALACARASSATVVQ